MIRGKFCLKTHEILQNFVNFYPLLSPFHLPSYIGRESKDMVEEQKAEE